MILALTLFLYVRETCSLLFEREESDTGFDIIFVCKRDL